MTIALLATGDEIIIGDTLNTNSQQLAHALNAEGLTVGLHMTCGDDEKQLYTSIQFLAERQDIIIMTGGLGPTSDDKTRYALASVMGIALTAFPAAIAHIQQRLRHSAVAMSPGNQQQALFPPNATLLPNPNGTAMGCYCSWKNKLFIMLPGPPRECLPMFNHYVLPILQKGQRNDGIQLLKWRVFGVAEGQIAQQMDEALAHIDCETGYRLETPYVECKVRCSTHLVDKVKAIIEPLLSPHIIASPDKKASEMLAELIAEKQIKVSIQDNVTGGLLQCLIQEPTNYQLLKFSNPQVHGIHFELDGLKEYWTSDTGANTTSLRVKYQYNNNSGEESHELPFRSALVVHIAAEWLSFRLFHLINQLHQ